MKVNEMLSEDPIIESHANYFMALNKELRVRMLCIIHHAQKLTNGDMVMVLGLNSSTTSNTLRIMVDLGLLSNQDIYARMTWYFISPNARPLADFIVGQISSSKVIKQDIARYDELFAKKELKSQGI